LGTRFSGVKVFISPVQYWAKEGLERLGLEMIYLNPE
jgi:hypothetical protein